MKVANDSEGRPAPWEFQTSYQSRAGLRAFGYRFRGAYAGINTCNVDTRPRAPDMGEHAQEDRTEIDASFSDGVRCDRMTLFYTDFGCSVETMTWGKPTVQLYSLST